MNRGFVLRLLLGGIIPLSTGRAVAWAAQAEGSDANSLSLEVAALQVLHDLELSPAQLDGLAKLARQSAPKEGRREAAKVSADLNSALKSLRDALQKGDDERISDCRDKFDELMEKEEPELDNHVTVSEEARRNAAAALKLLNLRQLGSFLSSLDLTDPMELLMAGAEQVRLLEVDQRKDEISKLADEIAGLINSEDGDTAQKLKSQIAAFLEKAADLKKETDFEQQRKALEKEAKDITGEVDNLKLLNHVLEQGMAELLSNPRLEAAIKARKRINPAPRPTQKSKSGR
jgi:hypothetical protein